MHDESIRKSLTQPQAQIVCLGRRDGGCADVYGIWGTLDADG